MSVCMTRSGRNSYRFFLFDAGYVRSKAHGLEVIRCLFDGIVYMGLFELIGQFSNRKFLLMELNVTFLDRFSLPMGSLLSWRVMHFMGIHCVVLFY